VNTENKAYPVNIRGELTIPPGRGWWLLKFWLLAIPHYICLIGLGIAFIVVWVITFFAILFTGKHPKSLFDFKVGVLRWSWRVGFYSLEAFGTDKYPPFSLQPDDSYPADLSIEYVEQMSRGLALVKWWLLAIPHYIVVSFFGMPIVFACTLLFFALVGAITFAIVSYFFFPGFWNSMMSSQQSNGGGGGGGGGSLVVILAFFAGIALLFTGKYPQSIFKLVIGFNRWVYRVYAYATFMTDEYPPFRFWDD
jgi:hypothetical protein